MGRRDSSYDSYARRDADRFERRRSSSRRSSPVTFHDGLKSDGRARRKFSGFDIALAFAVFGLSIVATLMGVSQDKYSHREDDA